MPARKRTTARPDDKALLTAALPLLSAGWPERDVAEEIGCDLRALRRALRSETGRRALARVAQRAEDHAAAAAQYTKNVAVEAAGVLRAIALGDPGPDGKHPDAHARIKAADSLLDRAGVSRETTERVEVDVRKLHVSEIVAKLRAFGVQIEPPALPGGASDPIDVPAATKEPVDTV